MFFLIFLKVFNWVFDETQKKKHFINWIYKEIWIPRLYKKNVGPSFKCSKWEKKFFTLFKLQLSDLKKIEKMRNVL